MSKIGELKKLLKETAEAHHKAFEHTQGVDEEWPKWYAKYLLEHGLQNLFEKKSVT